MTADGSSWSTGTVPSTNSSDNSPTLTFSTTYYGSNSRSCLAYHRAPSTIYYTYYRNGPDSTGWGSTRNLSQIVPGSYNSHQNPSISISGSSGDKRLHAVWEARSGTSGNYYVIIHRKATDWFTWPSVYSATYYEEQIRPSVTGLSDATAELLFRMFSQNHIYKIHYDGSYWTNLTFIASGSNPSASMGHTNAKYVWTEGGTSPYQIKVSSETLSKLTSPLTPAYHRSVAVLDTALGAWFEFRLDNLLIKTKSGEELALSFASAKEDTSTLKPSQVFSNLATSLATLPADAESLLVDCVLGWQDLSSIKVSSNSLAVELALTSAGGVTIKVPAVNAVSSNQQQTKLRLKADISVLSGLSVSLSTRASGVSNKSTLIASLGHIYEFTDNPATKELVSEGMEAPSEFSLSAYPNPFNPSTQIRFTLPRAGMATLRVYNLSGQMVRELVNDEREAGKYSVIWDSRNDGGEFAASGVYFIRFEAGEVARVSKITLVR